MSKKLLSKANALLMMGFMPIITYANTKNKGSVLGDKPSHDTSLGDVRDGLFGSLGALGEFIGVVAAFAGVLIFSFSLYKLKSEEKRGMAFVGLVIGALLGLALTLFTLFVGITNGFLKGS